jgi:hypothetical protein
MTEELQGQSLAGEVRFRKGDIVRGKEKQKEYCDWMPGGAGRVYKLPSILMGCQERF